jgi:hypothetical protein
MRSLLLNTKLPASVLAKYGSGSGSDSETRYKAVADLLGLNVAQQRVLQVQKAKRLPAAKLAAKAADDESDGSAGGLQSYMTARWWGSLADRIANRKAIVDGAGGAEAAAKAAPAPSTSGSTGTPAGSGTTTSPYLGPDVPPPAISLSELDREVSVAQLL